MFLTLLAELVSLKVLQKHHTLGFEPAATTLLNSTRGPNKNMTKKTTTFLTFGKVRWSLLKLLLLLLSCQLLLSLFSFLPLFLSPHFHIFTSSLSSPHLSLFLCGCQPEVTIETNVTMETVGCSSGGSRLSLSPSHTLTDDTDMYCTKNIHST